MENDVLSLFFADMKILFFSSFVMIYNDNPTITKCVFNSCVCVYVRYERHTKFGAHRKKNLKPMTTSSTESNLIIQKRKQRQRERVM